MSLLGFHATARAPWALGFLRPAAHCRRLISGAILAALLSYSVQPALAQNATSGTTVYGTSQQAGTTWQGGTISEGATVRLDSGATVASGSGNPIVNGTLQFNQTSFLTISSTIQGPGTLSVTNTGTLNLTGQASPRTVRLNGTTNVSAGQLRVGTSLASGSTYRIQLGYGTTGTLNLTGGSVTGSTTYIGSNAGGVGVLNVSGGTFDTTKTNSAALYLGNGSSGTGTLNLTGGLVKNGNGVIGNEAGSVGIATIESGTWANSGVLYAGYSGTGTLNVTGGLVQSSASSIGFNTNSSGTATVSSGTWANSGNLTVGEAGTGTLNLSGGSVTSASGKIGFVSGGVGSVTVSNTGSGYGTWTISGDLAVGDSGTGSLAISKGLVIVGGGLTRGSNGTIDLSSSGTLQIGSGTTGGVLLGGTGSLANNGTLIFNRSDASTYSGVLSGSGAVVKQGAGTLTISSGSNSYTGGTTISAGQLTLANARALGTGGALTITGGSLDLNGQSIALGALSGSSGGTITTGTAGSITIFSLAATNSTFAGAIGNGSGTIGLTKLGTGTLTLSGSNGYTGLTSLNDGVLALGNTNALAGGGTISFGGGTLQYSSSNTADYSARILGSGSAIAIDTNSQNVAFASSLGSSNTGGLTKTGLGTLTLSASNAYSGATTVSGGVLAYGASDVLSDSTAVTVASGTLNVGSYTDTVASFAITSGSLAGSGKLTAATYALGGGTVTANLGAGSITVTANTSLSGTADVTAVSLSAGTLALGSAGRFSSNQVALTGSAGASLSLGGNESIGSLAGGFNVALGSGTLTTGNDNTSTTYAGVLSGSGGLTKAGSGVLSLTGSNSYTGATTASAGELKVNGSTGTGAMTIASAAILSGTGTIGGATTISGTHMPGNSPGIQTFTSDLTYAQVGLTGPRIFWELAGNTTSNSPLAYDQINVGGNLNFGAGTELTLAFGGPGSTVDWSNSFWATDEQWTIYNVGGTTSGFSYLLLTTANWLDGQGHWFNSLLAGSTFSLLQIGQDVVLKYTVAQSAVPEIDPASCGSALTLLIGSLGLIEKRRRRFSSASLAG